MSSLDPFGLVPRPSSGRDNRPKTPANARAAAARDDFYEFVQYVCPWFRPAQKVRHHEYLCRKLEAVERGEIRRLMIFMPPRHGKSTLASICFPAWVFGRHPNKSVIATAYAGDLAGQVGGDVRNVIRDDLYTDVFPAVSLTENEKARMRWSVRFDEDRGARQGGRYIAAGVGGQVTGRGGHILLIDDPVKDYSEATSLTYRERAYHWYLSGLYTRQAIEGAAIVLIMTRWHSDDLAGRLLSDMEAGADQWEVLSLPALAKHDDALGRAPGEPLWPEYFDVARYEQLRKTQTVKVGPLHFAALYQQEPTEEKGNYFRDAWITPYMYPLDSAPKHLTHYIASDYAVTAGGGNWTVHLVVGVDARGHIWLRDLWRQQADPMDWCLAWVNLVKRWKPLHAAEENGQIIKGVGPLLDQLIIKHSAWTARSSRDGDFVPSRDKATRARSIAGRMQMGMVHIPTDAPWTAELVQELKDFRGEGDEQDDQVDALSLVGLMLNKLHGEDAPEEKPPENADFRKDRRRKQEDEARRTRTRLGLSSKKGVMAS